MKKSTACITLAALCAGLTACAGKEEKLRADTPVETEFSEVSVHDPSVVEGEDGSYYIFGSHMAVAKTDDLINWTYVNQGVKNDNDLITD